MKKCIIPLLAFAAVACTREIPDEMQIIEKELTISASFGDRNFRSQRAADGAVLWSPGDEISLFYGSGTDGGSRFTAQNTEPSKVVNFTGKINVITGGNDVAPEDTYFWAVYPYNGINACDGNSITTYLPDAQLAEADTFADDLFPSMGRSQGLTMGFYNICGGLKITISEEGIKSVVLHGNNDEPLAGTVTVSFDSNGLPEVVNIDDESDTITISAPEGQFLEVGKSYYFVFVPTVFEEGFTLTFCKAEAMAMYIRSKKTTIRRSAFGALSAPDADLKWYSMEPVPTLSQIIAIPQFYYDGIEALGYRYLSGNYLTVSGTATGTDYEGVGGYTIRGKNSYTTSNAVYTIGSEETAEYFINPEGYNFETEVSQWGFDCLDRNCVETRAGYARWSAKFKGITRIARNIGRVSYTIQNFEYLMPYDYYNKIVSVMSLWGIDTVNDNRMVSSGFAAVVAVKQELKHLAFSTNYQAQPCDASSYLARDKRKLYDTAAEAAENAPSVPVLYNGGPFSLDIVGVHVTYEGDNIYPLSEIKALYPDLDLKFELIEYTLGNNNVPENAFGIIDGNTFYPALARANDAGGFDTVKIDKTNQEEGHSSVGRRPIVLVKLVDKSNKIILAGYFKIVIVSQL
ncbi:MAG: fimbrillin family protein [Bacteroidales bacterium]|nr:fimbrillin family protein [Bacteroidales bacterium]